MSNPYDHILAWLTFIRRKSSRPVGRDSIVGLGRVENALNKKISQTAQHEQNTIKKTIRTKHDVYGRSESAKHAHISNLLDM